jgi:hypothetical protein
MNKPREYKKYSLGDYYYFNGSRQTFRFLIQTVDYEFDPNRIPCPPNGVNCGCCRAAAGRIGSCVGASNGARCNTAPPAPPISSSAWSGAILRPIDAINLTRLENLDNPKILPV